MKYSDDNRARKPRLHADESGLVAIFVVMIIMILLTLIVLAFGSVARREQRQALDRQLNSQALFAAESGVNDALRAIRTEPSLANRDYTSCEGGADDFIDTAELTQSISENISYSCLLLDSSPERLSYSGVAKGTSRVVPIRPEDSNTSRLDISWGTANYTGQNNVDGCHEPATINEITSNYYESGPRANCNYPVMRLELIRFDNLTNHYDLIESNRAIFFAQPASNAFANEQSFASGIGSRQGRRVVASCADPNNSLNMVCSMRIGSLPNNFRGYLRMTPIYYDANINISAVNSSDQSVGLAGAQIEIDVTGKASDILKRIRVFTSIAGDGNTGVVLPEFALQSTTTQCKRFAITSVSIDWDTSEDPACGL